MCSADESQGIDQNVSEEREKIISRESQARALVFLDPVVIEEILSGLQRNEFKY